MKKKSSSGQMTPLLSQTYCKSACSLSESSFLEIIRNNPYKVLPCSLCGDVTKKKGSVITHTLTVVVKKMHILLKGDWISFFLLHSPLIFDFKKG